MAEKLRYALIGCGRIAPNHIGAVHNMSDKLELTAVCDILPEHIDILDRTIPIGEGVRRYTDYKEMVEKERPQLVAIATDSGLHAQIALYCISHGIHCMIEKPIAMSISDADAIIAAAKDHHVVVTPCHQNRFNRAVQTMRNALEEGRFGRLFYGVANIRWNRNENYYKQASWRGTWAMDGGTLMNQCIHNIDLLRWMMGNEVEEVMAYTDRLNHDYIEAEDLGIALVKFKNGRYGVIEGTTNISPKNMEETLSLFGSEGTARLGGIAVNLIDFWQFTDGKDNGAEVIAAHQEAPKNVYGSGNTPLYADVIDSILHHHSPYLDAEDGKRALELVLGIYQAAATALPVKFPLKECSTLDFIGRFDK